MSDDVTKRTRKPPANASSRTPKQKLKITQAYKPKKHGQREDFPQAAVRIVKEATEDH